MRFAFRLTVLATFLWLCNGLCAAQCAETWQQMQFHCAGPDGCEGDLEVQYPGESSQYGVAIVCGSENCCGQLFTTCYAGGGCEPESVRKPEARKRLDRIAATSEVLVADCKGRFSLYTPSSALAAYRASSMMLNDHVLR